MSKNTGGPAFPGDVTTRYPRSMLYGDSATGSEVVTQSHQGMTLRDYFAAKAMQGFLARDDVFNFEMFKQDPWRVAMWSYEAADAMIAEREKE